MPEKVGTVTGLITNPRKNNEVFGLNIDGEEYLYSFEEYRGEPFDADSVKVGCGVRVEYQDTEKAGKTKKYIGVLEAFAQTVPAPSDESPLPAEFNASGELVSPAPSTWGYREKDILMFIESCAKGACGIYAAALAGGQIKEMPTGGEITALARSIEEHGVARFRALLEALD